MKRYSKNILLIVLILALAGSAWYTFDQYRQLKKIKMQLRYVRSENDELEEKVSALKDEKAQLEDEEEELEEQLDEVERSAKRCRSRVSQQLIPRFIRWMQ